MRNLITKILFLLIICSSIYAQNGGITVPPPISINNSCDSAEVILQRYVKAWRGTQEMDLKEEITVAFWINGEKGGNFHIVINPEGKAELLKGIPDKYTFGYETDIETLRKLDRQEINSHTAIGAEKSGDPIPLGQKFPNDLKWTWEFETFYRRFHFHFWNREFPEVIRFGKGTTRRLHGADSTLFYYEPGIRSGWFKLEPNSHVNPNPDDQTNPFSSMFIITRGSVNSKLGGVKRVLREGEAVFVPKGMTHEFWTDKNQYAEGVLLMFGDGS